MSGIEADQHSTVNCNDCDAVIVFNEQDGKRLPCPKCGSTRRHFKETVVYYVGTSAIQGGINGDNDKR